jgi:DNA-binding winged helix-turn-helix (wHTH) protein
VVFKFGDHVLDIERRELRRGPELVALEPQVFDLLAYLVRNRGRVVSKDDFIHGVWGGRIVSDSALTTRLNAARKAVNDSGAAQRVIRTLARKGVRFVAEVTEDGLLEAPAAAPEPPIALTDKPSIAVLPFQNMSGDPEQEYFTDGIVEGITTAISERSARLGIWESEYVARFTSPTQTDWVMRCTPRKVLRTAEGRFE